jgi:hypothetical protein
MIRTRERPAARVLAELARRRLAHREPTPEDWARVDEELKRRGCAQVCIKGKVVTFIDFSLQLKDQG